MNLFLLSFFAGGALYWWRGHSSKRKKYFPRPWNQMVFALPYAVMAWPVTVFHIFDNGWFFAFTKNHRFLGDWILNQWWSGTEVMAFCILVFLVVLALTWAAVLSGHGRGMSIGEPMELGDEPETLEFPILWLEPYLPVYWYKALILAITGLAITLPAGLALMNPLVMASGLLKAPAYMIGRAISRKYSTQWGEFLTGGFLWGSLALIMA